MGPTGPMGIPNIYSSSVKGSEAISFSDMSLTINSHFERYSKGLKIYDLVT